MAEMTINGKDIKVFNARIQHYTVSGTAVTHNTSAANEFVVMPDLYYSTFGPRTLTVTLTFFPRTVGADSRNTSIPERLHRATENMVRFESLIVGKVVEICLPDGFYYTALAQTLPAADFDSTGEHDVTYTFLAIRHLNEMVEKTTPGGKVFCRSNTPTKFKISALFPQSHETVTLCGVIISNIPANAVVVIDTVRGLITCNGVNKFLDTDFYDFPLLYPGENIISCTAADAELQVVYTPVFA